MTVVQNELVGVKIIVVHWGFSVCHGILRDK